MYNELRTVLNERAKLETQFRMFKNIHAETINRLMNSFNTTEEDVLTTLYLSKFVVTGDITSTAQTQVQQYLSDDERVELILQNLIESKKYLPGLELKKRVMLQQLTWRVGWEVEKLFRRNISGKIYPMDVIFVHSIDQLIVPLLDEHNNVFTEEERKKFDFRWILAEILSALTNDFPLNVLRRIKSVIPVPNLTSNDFFIAGWVLCEEFMKFLFPKEKMLEGSPIPTPEESVSEPVVERKAEEPIEPSPEQVVKTPEKTSVEPEVEPIAEFTDKQVIKTEVKSVVEPSPEQAVETSEKPPVEPITEPVIKTEVKPIVESKTETSFKPVMESSVETPAETRTQVISPPKTSLDESILSEEISHRHLTDPLTFGGLFIYDKNNQSVIPEIGKNLFTSRGTFEIDDSSNVIKNLMSLDHPAITQGKFLFKNCNYAFNISTKDKQKSQRFLYINKITSENSDVGLWAIFLLQSEDINTSYLENMLLNRIPIIDNHINLRKKFNRIVINFDKLISSFIHTLIADLQDDISYVGHLEDQQKTQKYLLMGVSQATTDHRSDTLVHESVADYQRISTGKTDSLFLNQIKGIYQLTDYVTTFGISLFNNLIKDFQIELEEFNFVPSEILFYAIDDPLENLLLYSVSKGENPKKPEEILTVIASNKSIGDIVHRGKAFQSRRNIQRAVRLIAESRDTIKLRERVKDRLQTGFTHNIIESRLDKIWRVFFDIHKGKVKEVTSLDTTIQEHEDTIQSEHIELINNVVFYIIKDLIIPYQLLNAENEMLQEIKTVGNPKDIIKVLESNDRRITSLKNRMNQTPDSIKGIILDQIKKDKPGELSIYIKEITNKLTEKALVLTEMELKDILISF
jgi:hypothetical protein